MVEAGPRSADERVEQPPQRDLPGALEIGLAGLHRHHIGQRHPQSEDKQHRGFATRYDKLAVRYDATVQITSIDIWLRDLSNRA